MKRISNFIRGSNRLLLPAICMMAAIFLCCGKKSASSDTGNNPADMASYSGSFVKSDLQDSTQGSGSVTASLNKSTLKLTYSLTWHGLSSMPVAMHFHDSGPVIVLISGFPVQLDGTVSGVATLTSEQAVDLAAGRIYAMIHTENYTSGEILAYMIKQ